MNRASLKALEWGHIQTLLTARASRDHSRAFLSGLCPGGLGREEVVDSFRTIADVRALRGRGGSIGLGGIPEVADLLDSVNVEGAALEGIEIVRLASFARGAARVGADVLARLKSVEAGTLNRPERLVATGRILATGAELPFVSEVEKKLAPNGEVRDDASPELQRLRAKILRLRESLSLVFASFLDRPDSDRVLQDKVVASRNGRSVLMVKSEARSVVKGVLHASSRGGQTAFIEPLEAVTVNNDIAATSDEEQEEIRRILRGLSALARESASDLRRMEDEICTLDRAHAKATLADDLGAMVPRIAEDPRALRVVDGVHPLLMDHIRESLGLARSGRTPVPLRLEILPDAPLLVIGGPNTGGKTVALKCVGLLALMASSGLHVPAAAETTLPLFGQVFADIGDDQSLSEGLSTFSGQLLAIAQMNVEPSISLASLVLLDELGSGTDPLEGGALGSAILENFAERGALVIATTHNGDVKAFAATHALARCASFGYDDTSFVPTYTLVPDSAGRSLAIETAARLGLPATVVERARSLLPESSRRAETLLRELSDQKEKLAERERAVEEVSRAVEDERAVLTKRLDGIEAERDRARTAFEREMEAERAETENRLRLLFEDAESRLKDDKSQAALGRLRVETLQAVARAPQPGRDNVSSSECRVGDLVRAPSLGWEGRVIAVAVDDAEIDVRGKRVRLQKKLLVPLARRTAQGLVDTYRNSEPERAPVTREINLIGQRVDEATAHVDKLLDDAFLADEASLRIIHGFGEGRLRRAIRDLLKTHPHVASFREASPAEGGGGATIVELRR